MGPRLAAALVVLATVAVPVPALRAEADAAGEAVLVAAGDVALCDHADDEATAALLDQVAGTVAMLGDGAYPDGTATQYRECYGSSWGRHRDRTRPVPGNHDYVEAGAPGYYGFFGTAAGDPAKGYYSYDLGAWHIVALNSNCHEVGGCGAGAPMEQWLRSDLASKPTRCVLAYWHHPRFFSTAPEPGVKQVDPSDVKMSVMWKDLQAAGADVVLTAHVHVYERFARQDSAGSPDPAGMRQFVVGTGGGKLGTFTGEAAPNSEIRNDKTWGVLKLTLRPDGYGWQFLPVAGSSFTDSGSDTCGG